MIVVSALSPILRTTNPVRDLYELARLAHPPATTDFGPALKAHAHLFDIGGQQRQGGQRRRADGEALARRGRRVAQASSASVRSRTSAPGRDISALPPALSAIGP